MCFQGGEASQNGGRTNEKLNSGAFEDKGDKKEKDEETGGFQAMEEEPEGSVLDAPNKSAPQRSKQEGMAQQIPPTKHQAKTSIYGSSIINN